MADPATSPTGWIQYGYNRRYNPNTGEVQYDLNGTGNWQTVTNLGKYDPQNPLSPSFGTANPNLLSDPSLGRQFLLNQGGGGWALPSADILRQINMMSQMAQNAPTGQAGSAAPGTIQAPSYWGTTPQINMGGAWQPSGVAQAGSVGAPGAAGAQGGGGTSMATNVASKIPTNVSIPEWQTWYGRNVGKTIMVGGQPRTIGQDINPDQMLQAFQNQTVGWNVPQAAAAPTQPAQPIGGPGQAQPESVALAQMQQIDPTSEALRQALGQSYLSNLGGGPPAPQFGLDLSKGAASPAAGDVQSYLDLYKQIDPQGFAQRQAMGQQVSDYVTRVTGQTPTSPQDALAKYQQLDPQGFQQLQSLGTGMSSYLSTAQQNAALGSQLDPGTIREVEQGVRSAQGARGNVYGTPQLVAETMARGSAGEARNIQRQQALGQALGLQQGYLGSGLTLGALGNQLYGQGLSQQQGALGAQQAWLSSGQSMGDIANNLYQQGYGRYLQGYGTQLSAWQAQQNARLQSQGAALGYLGSGQTPYQAGASYLNMAQQNAAAAAQGGPQYNPASLGQQYTGAGAPSFPQYGLDMSQLAGNWYNNINQANLQAYGLGQAYGQKGGSGMGAATGALSGAASGALAGSAAMPGWGTLIGAGIGAVAGGLGGYSK